MNRTQLMPDPRACGLGGGLCFGPSRFYTLDPAATASGATATRVTVMSASRGSCRAVDQPQFVVFWRRQTSLTWTS